MKVKSSGLYARFFLRLFENLFYLIIFSFMLCSCSDVFQIKSKNISDCETSSFGCSNTCSSDGKSCSASSFTKRLRVVSWNLQTFFDGETDGTEYSEFIKSAKWGRDAYSVRLSRLCSAIRALDADVVIMEELEKEAQLIDISNGLCSTFQLSKLYSYGCFSSCKGSSIGCAVISRYPLSDFSIHSLDVRTESSSMPSMRSVMEVSVCAGGKKFVLFVNHWKSKSGGAAETEVWRNWQESVLAYRIRKIQEKGFCAVLACGDFNRDVSEFAHPAASGSSSNVLLRINPEKSTGIKTDGEQCAAVFSPWYTEAGSLLNPGSYFYDGQWERIDNFFCAGRCALSCFSPESCGPWVDSEKHPLKYCVWTGEGYSDHLPIGVDILF